MSARTYTLPSGKILQVTKMPNIGLFQVSFTTGGQLPEALTGAFTDPNIAEKHIIQYINTKTQPEKPEKNGTRTQS